MSPNYYLIMFSLLFGKLLDNTDILVARMQRRIFMTWKWPLSQSHLKLANQLYFSLNYTMGTLGPSLEPLYYELTAASCQNDGDKSGFFIRLSHYYKIYFDSLYPPSIKFIGIEAVALFLSIIIRFYEYGKIRAISWKVDILSITVYSKFESKSIWHIMPICPPQIGDAYL